MDEAWKALIRMIVCMKKKKEFQAGWKQRFERVLIRIATDMLEQKLVAYDILSLRSIVTGTLFSDQPI